MARAEIVDIPKNKEMCINCRKVLAIKNNFYAINDNAIEHKVYKNGYIPICKNCLNEMCYTDKKQTKIDIESFKMVLAILQIPFKEDVFDEMIKNNSFTLGDYKNKVSFMCKNDIYYNQSETKTDNEEDKINKVSVKEDDFDDFKITRKMIRKWGKNNDYSESDYMYLEDYYNQLTEEKGAKSLLLRSSYINLAKTQLHANKALEQGDIKAYNDLIKTTSTIMKDAKISANDLKDNDANGMTLGQLIEKFEEEKPISKVSKKFEDVDKIKKYFCIFFIEPIKRLFNMSNESVDKDLEKVKDINDIT